VKRFATAGLCAALTACSGADGAAGDAGTDAPPDTGAAAGGADALPDGAPIGPPGPVDPARPPHPVAESPPDWPLFTGPPALTPRADATVPVTPARSGLSVSAARGEAESLWLSLGPGEGAVTAKVDGLSGFDVSVYGVGFTEGFGDTLAPLAPETPWPLSPNARGALLLDVRVPRGAASGPHAGTLRLRRAGRPDVALPLTVRVFDFDLPPEVHFSSQLNLDLAALVPPGADADAARDLLFGLRLTPANPVWPSSFRWDITWDSPSNPARCRALFDEPDEAPAYGVGALARHALLGEGWNGVGFPDAAIFQFVDNATPRPATFCGEARGDAFGTPAYNVAWSAWLTALGAYLRAHGLADRTYAYLQNEPQTPDDARLAAHLCRLVRAAAPGLRIAISEQPTRAIAEDPGGACGYDIWMSALQHLEPAYALVRQRDFGEQLWLYSLDHDPAPYFNPTSPTRDTLHARVIPWVSWRLRARGWAYSDGDRFFPGGRPNLRALALRDGFEDYEYLYLANGGRHPTPGAAEAVDRTVAGVATGLTDWNRDPAVLATLRDALGAYLSGERADLPVVGAEPGTPPEARAVNFQDPSGEPAADPLVVDGRTWEKVGWGPWDAERRLGFLGEHVGDDSGIARAGYDAVEGFDELARSYLYDDFGRPALFELGLAPGHYRVRIGLGRPARGYPNDPHNVTLEGVPVVVDHLTTDAAPTFVYEGDVEVLDGRLSVGFGGRSARTGEFAYTFLSFLSADPLEPSPP
jgi:hypothetical protein